MNTEIFKPIPDYDGTFEVSNFGNIRSIRNGIIRNLKPSNDGHGYLCICLTKNNIRKTFKVHQLVAVTFLNHKPCGHKLVIDHINDIKNDNRVENLQIITNRQNAYKTQGKYSSKYKGVHWDKKSKKWVSRTRINGKTTCIGLFDNEYDAHLAYINTIKQLL